MDSVPAPRTDGAVNPAEIGGRAVAWLARSMDHFDPSSVAPEDRSGRLLARKALAELAELVGYRARLMPMPAEDAYVAILDRIERIAARRSYRDLIARQRRSLWLYAAVHAALRAWGREDPELRWMIEQAVDSRYPVTWERLPYRLLDYAHVLGIGGIRGALPSLDEAFGLTLLNWRPNIAELTEDDAYALTHTVFYMTDLGLRVPPWTPAFDAEGATELIDALLRHHRVRGQSDLVAELLICSVCLGGAPAERERAWRHLGETQSADGGVRTPAHLVDPPRQGRETGAWEAWRSSYHTTILTALAALVTERRRFDAGYPLNAGRPSEVAPPSPEVSAALQSSRSWLEERCGRPSIADALVAAAGVAASFPGGPDGRGTPGLVLVADRVARGEADALDWSGVRGEPRRALAAWLRLRGARCAQLEGSPQPGEDGSAERTADIPLDTRLTELLLACAEYRLGDAAGGLCELVRLGAAEDRAVRDAIEFLVGQQRMDGSFGYSAADAEAPELARARLQWTAAMAGALAVASVRRPASLASDMPAVT